MAVKFLTRNAKFKPASVWRKIAAAERSKESVQKRLDEL